MRWLLLSDLHFKHHDLDRVRKTAQWIVMAAERNKVGRVVVCGDLLTSRTMHSTNVLSACYRFIGQLSEVVPRVHIVLGNHDLAYRRDYQTTALDALNISRLAPFVTLHSGVARHEWDGRRVLLLPFREEQEELTKAVAALCPTEASNTVAFAHLAINKAITQRHVVSTSVDKPRVANSITYRGLTGPDQFASLARTFTGHFHSHQTITQERSDGHHFDLQGSITYLGSPLQLSWSDLDDEQRGVVLFDPETLAHEMLINPHAVGYTTTDLRQVLEGQVDQDAVLDKHVMLLGELTRLKYVSARDRLLSMGVRSVRSWTPMGFFGGPSFGGLGSSVPVSDASVQPLNEPTKAEPDLDITSDSISGPDPVTGPEIAKFDLGAEAREFVEGLELDKSLLSRRDELVRVGQRLIQASHEMTDTENESEVNYRDFLDKSSQTIGTKTATELVGSSTHVFVAEPRRLLITNFLGVNGTITIDFRQDLRRGLTFLVGDNGSGKSTLVEAMIWCQFGRCIRSGLAVNDVVNDSAGKNCSVMLEFANGYSITRYRKHKTHGNRVVVSLHGEPQPQLEHPDMRTTQAAVDELLGIDYETYVRTVVLGHESTASFLTSTQTQRRDLIEESLGLSILDKCGQLSKLLLKDLDKDIDEVEGMLEGLLRTMEYSKRRLKDLDGTRKRLKEEAKEAEEAVASLETVIQEYAATEILLDAQGPFRKTHREFGPEHSDLDADVIDAKQDPFGINKVSQGLLNSTDVAGVNVDFRVEISALQEQIYIGQENLRRLEASYARIQEEEKRDELTSRPTSRLGWLQRQLSQRLGDMATGHPVGLHKFLSSMKTSILNFGLSVVRGLSYIFKIPKDGSQGPSAQDHNQAAAIGSLRKDIENSMSRLQILENEMDRIIALEKLAISHIAKLKKHFAQAFQAQESLRALQQQAALKQRDVATYTDLVETDQSSLQSLRLEHKALTARRNELDANRELFAFWSSNLGKRSRRTSSPSSTTNFREYVLVKPLAELNELLARILTTMYDHNHSARGMAKGMLQSLLEPDCGDAEIDDSSGSVLQPTLAVHPSLAYGKRSGGERKRVDLALFFSLMQLMWARSAHRAHYMLVDEVFDSLDEAGQAAVIRWCGLMSQTVAGWIVVITHSQFLIEKNVEEEAGKVSVMRARMGEDGMELVVDARRIGVQ
ncbi:unnamed protein product [Clonostachys rhizophaga]|uniref:Rad50/SbcC-type AAA domain-containing protein n=1 Tax=Clonostachys rhizophaga TaxID=160324 RepID=A0A9N9YHG6_9HYPO|nr:unnamed protein product [Clonostachys rhizophaga]